MYGSLSISTSGMIAQRTRLQAIQQNLANQDAIFDPQGRLNPYRRREVLLAPGNPTARGRAAEMGVQVVDIPRDQSPLQVGEWDPHSPRAYTSGPHEGYVAKTNVNPVFEQVSAIEAVRAYEANVMAAEATKQMVAASLRMLA